MRGATGRRWAGKTGAPPPTARRGAMNTRAAETRRGAAGASRVRPLRPRGDGVAHRGLARLWEHKRHERRDAGRLLRRDLLSFRQACGGGWWVRLVRREQAQCGHPSGSPTDTVGWRGRAWPPLPGPSRCRRPLGPQPLGLPPGHAPSASAARPSTAAASWSLSAAGGRSIMLYFLSVTSRMPSKRSISTSMSCLRGSSFGGWGGVGGRGEKGASAAAEQRDGKRGGTGRCPCSLGPRCCGATHDTRTRRAAATMSLSGTMPTPCLAIHSTISSARCVAGCGAGRTKAAARAASALGTARAPPRLQHTHAGTRRSRQSCRRRPGACRQGRAPCRAPSPAR
jgi:hypothetical protein